SASECTFLAKKPIRIPAIIPLIVEPTTMLRSCDRTSGVNQDVNPSKIPSTPPRINPYTTLFIAGLLGRLCAALILLLNAEPNSFSAAAKKVEKLARSSTPEPARLLPDTGSPSEPPCEIHFRDRQKQANHPDIERYRSQARLPTHNDWRDLQPSLFVISPQPLSEQIPPLHAAHSCCSIALLQPLAAYCREGTEELRRANKYLRVRPDHQFRLALVRVPCISACLEPFHARFSRASFLPANSQQELQRDL